MRIFHRIFHRILMVLHGPMILLNSWVIFTNNASLSWVNWFVIVVLIVSLTVYIIFWGPEK